MGDILYVISTYYHAYIACIKQLICRKDADILITDYIPECECLADRIRECGIFSEVYCIKHPVEYIPANKFDLVFNLHRKNAAMLKDSFPMNLNSYRVIDIFHDDTWVAHYLKDTRHRYRLIEDGLDSFKTIKETPFSYMVTKVGLKSLIKRVLRIGYVFNGYDPITTEVEVNDKNGVIIAESVKHKLVEVPRNALQERLSEQDADVLCRVFAREIPSIDPHISALLVTQPLYADGVAISMEEQLCLYRRLVRENIHSDETLVIKPHPRDEADYSAVFPGAIVFNKNMPAEMLPFYGVDNIRRCFGFNSTALKTIHADECVSCSLDDYINVIRRGKYD